MDSVPQAFDVTNAQERARVLAQLLRVRSHFTEEHVGVYNSFRDECMRFARGRGDETEVKKLFAILAPYMSSEATAAPEVNNTSPQNTASVPVESPLQSPPSAPTPSVIQEPVVMVHKRGPDISASISTPIVLTPQSDPSPISLKVEKEQVVTTSQSPMVQEESVVTAPPIASSQTATVAQAAQSPHIEEKPAPTVSQDPKVEVKPPQETVSTNGGDLTALQKEVEIINDALISLGHGRAFQWLNNPETQYKEYVTDLLGVRALLQNPQTDIAVVRERILALKTKAEVVTRAVSGNVQMLPTDAVPPQGKVTQNEPISEVRKISVADASPTVQSTQDPVMPEAPQKRNYGHEEDSAPVDIILHDKKSTVEDTPVLAEETTSVPPVDAERAAPQETPSPEEMTSETQVNVDPLMAPEITSGMNDLLVRWLGTSGFFGFGDSGIKHPDWVIMRHMLVDEVLQNDGTIPKGLKPETLANLAENMKSWRDGYKLLPIERELVEHFVRRVVFAGLSQKT